MNIAVYCGSVNGNHPAFSQAAELLGALIVARGDTLVYGGGESGLMGVIAGKVHQAGSPVIGVVPDNVSFIRERPQPYCTEVVRTENMSARKQKMMEMADLFIALPGGIGTMDEMTEVITLNRIGVFHKPCIMINADSYYEPFHDMLDRMIQAEFLEAEVYQYVNFWTMEKLAMELIACQEAQKAGRDAGENSQEDDCPGLPSGKVSGTCGPKLRWSLSDEGLLTIAGSGKMDNYDTYLMEELMQEDCDAAPWYEYGDEIREVTVREGVTSIGSCAFYNCEEIRKVSLPDSVNTIGWCAFGGCEKLEEINIPEGVDKIDNNTFSRCNSLEEIRLPKSIQYIGEEAFTITSFSRASSMVTLLYPGQRDDWAEVRVEEGNDIKIKFI